MQTFDGGIGEIDEGSWCTLALSRAEPTEGWDALNLADMGDSEAELPEEDREVAVQFVEVVEEVRENSNEEERDLVVGRAPVEKLAIDNPTTEELMR